MVFSSAIFIFCFLPILFFFYFCLPKKCKNIVLLIFSLIFYAFGGVNYLFTLLLTVFISYLGGILIKKCSKKKLVLFLTIALNLSFLICIKWFSSNSISWFWFLFSCIFYSLLFFQLYRNIIVYFASKIKYLCKILCEF